MAMMDHVPHYTRSLDQLIYHLVIAYCNLFHRLEQPKRAYNHLKAQTLPE
jgi:hypothetical protein